MDCIHDANIDEKRETVPITGSRGNWSRRDRLLLLFSLSSSPSFEVCGTHQWRVRPIPDRKVAKHWN